MMKRYLFHACRVFLCIVWLSSLLVNLPSHAEELIDKRQELQDLKSQSAPFDIPGGNIWQTMQMFKAQAREIAGVRCNYCSGPQPCSTADLQKGGCVPQCPSADDPNKFVGLNGCSLPCEALNSISTPPLVGRFTLFEALEHLLEGTGVTYGFLWRPDEPGIELVLLDARRHFDIPAGPMTETLVQFRRQGGIRLFVPEPLMARAHTVAVQGYLTPTEALTRMLQGSDLAFWLPDKYPVSSLLVDQSEEQVLVVGTRSSSGMQLLTARPENDIDRPGLDIAPFASIDAALERLPVSMFGFKEDVDRGDNPTRGTAADLRGLGPAATLVLVNGHPQPASGLEGNFIDLSTIPWAAVERVEVLDDGASATYGSGAIGGVINIVMREDAKGAETRLRNSAVRGGASERLISQLFSHQWDGGSALVAYQLTKREGLPIEARTYARDTDKRARGGDDFSSTASNPGTILDPTTLLPAYAIPRSFNGGKLTAADLVLGENLYNWQAGSDLLPARRAHSAYGSLNQRLSDRWELNADARFHERKIALESISLSRELSVPRSNPYFVSPYADPTVLVDYNFGADLGNQSRDAQTRTIATALTLTGALGRAWHANLSASYGEERLASVDRNLINDRALEDALADEDPATAFNPFGVGSNTNPQTLDRIRQSLYQRAISSLQEYSASFDGPVAQWRRGSVRFLGGATYRKESLTNESSQSVFSFTTSSERASESLFSELTMPLPRAIDLSLAARAERFAGSGDVGAYKAALRWTPLGSLRLRGTWGRSYRAPDLFDLDGAGRSFIGLLNVPDPQAQSGRSAALLRVGASDSLRQEIADTWTAGIDFRSLVDTRFSLTYFSVDYRDRIVTPGTLPTSLTLTEESRWANIITRNPSRELVQSLCENPRLLGSPSNCLASSPIIIDARVRNGGIAQEEGLEASLEQPLKVGTGELIGRASALHLLRLDEGDGSLLPLSGVVGQIASPPRTRFVTSLDWYQRGEKRPGLSAGLTLSYTSAFRDTTRLQDQQAIRSSTELDARLSYKASATEGLGAGVQATLNVTNIANAPPPFANRPIGYDQQNSQPYGRVIALMLEKQY